MITDFDALHVMPDLHCAKIAKFLGPELRDEVLVDFRKLIRRPECSRRLSSIELAQYDLTDLAWWQNLPSIVALNEMNASETLQRKLQARPQGLG